MLRFIAALTTEKKEKSLTFIDICCIGAPARMDPDTG